jgi:hypothetical protein
MDELGAALRRTSELRSRKRMDAPPHLSLSIVTLDIQAVLACAV